MNIHGWRNEEGEFSLEDHSVVKIYVHRMRDDWIAGTVDPKTTPLECLLDRADRAVSSST